MSVPAIVDILNSIWTQPATWSNLYSTSLFSQSISDAATYISIRSAEGYVTRDVLHFQNADSDVHNYSTAVRFDQPTKEHKQSLKPIL